MKSSASIREKVLIQTIKLPIITLIIIAAIILAGLMVIKNSVVTISTDLGSISAASSREALEKQAKEQLTSLAKNKVALGDEKLAIIQDNVKLIANSATNIMKHSTKYMPEVVLPSNAANKGNYVLQLKYAEGLDLDSIKNEVNLMGNMHILVDIPESNSTIQKTYMGSESGYIITADKISDEEPQYADPRTRPWYISAIKEKKVIWTDVYEDIYGNGLAITCAAPYFDENGQVKGAVGIGWLMNEITEIVVGTKIGETGYAFVVNEKGDMIISPTLKQEKEGKIKRENLIKDGEEDMKQIAKKMIAGNAGLETIVLDKQQYYIAYEPFQILPWSFATLVPVEEVVKPAVASEAKINQMTASAVGNINKSMLMMIVALVIASMVMLSYIVYTAKRIATGISKPILDLTKGAEIIGGGDLSHKLEVTTGDEIERLANTFNLMIDSIQSITSEKERIGAELDVATKIQASMLPCIFPAFPDKTEQFDVYATMTPAKEVGGDFYDFFVINENKIGLVIADVSGKGVPAALFMVIAKTLIKNHAQMGKMSNEILEATNNQLCENNDTMMFVTCFMGVLDLETGAFTYVNAGHNPPFLMRKGEEYQEMAVHVDRVLGITEKNQFKSETIMMRFGDRIYMYTDGVTEAINEEEEQFSEERLMATLNELRAYSLKDTLYIVKDKVDKFCGKAPQFDDVTMLIFEYKNKEVK